MLRKLLKHEFRATGRVMLPMYAILLVTAVGANLSTRGLLDTDSWFLDMLGVLLIAAFAIACVAVCVIAFAQMINRFYKNLMGDEGYVMFTLPVSVHQQVWSKLIVSAVWFAATAVMGALAALIMAFDVDIIGQIFRGIEDVIQHLTGYYALNGAAMLAEFLLLTFVGCCALCLQFYAAMAAGHGFANHKTLMSVVFFFGFQTVLNVAGTLLIQIADAVGVLGWLPPWNIDGAAAIHLAMWISIAGVVIYGAIFYFVTIWCLKKHLNLE